MVIESFDYETSRRVEIDARIEEPGEVAVGPMLGALVKAAQGDTVRLDSTDGGLTMKAGRSSYRLPTFDMRDMPAVPDGPAATGNVPLSRISEALKAIAWSHDPKETREAVRGFGLFASASDRELTVVATDTRVLGHATVPYIGPDVSIHVPAAAFLASARDGFDDGGDLGIGASAHLLTLTTARTTTALRTEGVEFLANWRRLSEGERDGRIEVAAMELRAALNRLAIVAERSHVDIVAEDGGLRLSLADQPDAVEYVDAKHDGTGADFRVNGTYLAKALGALGDRQASIAHNNPRSSPLFVKPTDDLDPFFAVMPVRR